MLSRPVLHVPLLVLFMLLVSAGSAFATTALFVTDAEQAELSTAIVVATVGRAEVGPHERYETVATRTTIRVDEVLYGQAPKELVINQIGGTLNGMTVYIPGDARLERGERCVLFLRQVEGRWYLTAMEQSKYRLVEDSRFGTIMERRLGDGIVFRNATGELVDYEEPIRAPIKRFALFRSEMARLDAEKGAQ